MIGACTPCPIASRSAPATASPTGSLLADALTLLGTLADGSVDLAYADPPFATGKVRRAADGDGAGHRFDDTIDDPDAYCAWLLPHLAELHRVLAPTGSLFLHLDHRMSAHARDRARRGVRARRLPQRDHLALRARRARAGQRVRAQARRAALLRARPRQHVPPAARRADAGDGREVRPRRRARALSARARPPLLPQGRQAVRLGVGHPEHRADGARARRLSRRRSRSRCSSASCARRRTPGALVVDPFVGSGTTAVAAQRLGRRFVCGDRSPEAIAVTCGRLEREAIAQPAPDVLLSRP